MGTAVQLERKGVQEAAASTAELEASSMAVGDGQVGSNGVGQEVGTEIGGRKACALQHEINQESESHQMQQADSSSS